MNLTGRVNDDLKGFSAPAVPRPYHMSRTWVLAMNGQNARLFERRRGELEQIGIAHADAENAEITNKSIGRVISSATRSIHHKFEPHMNESRQQRMAFITQVSGWLEQALREDAFERIIFVAPPQILGDLRKTAKPSLRKRVFAEIHKDLTKLDTYALQEELENILVY